MDWLGMFNPNYWFFRQTRNDFARYWGEGQEWNGFFSAWLTSGLTFTFIFLMMVASSPGFSFGWQSLLVLLGFGFFMGFFFIPVATWVILMKAVAQEEIRNRRESHRRQQEELFRALQRQRRRAEDCEADKGKSGKS